ncbi:MAG: hypothetical protein ACTSPN_12705 [Promethearchaeota archaeon]
MKVMGDFEDIIETDIIHELKWLREEFDFLFRFKKNRLTQEDIEIANQIIDSVIDKYSGTLDDKIVDLLSKSIEEIGECYPGLESIKNKTYF